MLLEGSAWAFNAPSGVTGTRAKRCRFVPAQAQRVCECVCVCVCVCVWVGGCVCVTPLPEVRSQTITEARRLKSLRLS